MSNTIRCPRCGSDFPSEQIRAEYGGICPKCLAKAALPTGGTEVTAEPEPLKIGAHFRGLEVLEFLGRGGMGFVYKARQAELDRFVALKILSPKLASNPEFTARFNREAKALASLDHPGIVRVLEYGAEGNLCFLTMDFVDGVSLRDIQRSRKLEATEALQIVRQICEALEYAHAEGVVHRDIKPENILIDKKGRVKIADFGLAKILPSEGQRTVLTQTDVTMGTPDYMAPEQRGGLRQADHRADIYSLGVVFYELLTGEVPMGKFEPPSHRVQIDVRLDEIVLKALERSPERRYQRAAEVSTDLETVVSRPRDGEVFASTRSTSKRKYALLSLTAVGFLTAAGLLIRYAYIEGLTKIRPESHGAVTPVQLPAIKPPQEEPADSDYFVKAGDTIRVTVAGKPDLSLEGTVPPYGIIDYPVIGVVQLTGKTKVQIFNELYERLSKHVSQLQLAVQVHRVGKATFPVHAALRWLARHQNVDGSWSVKKYAEHCDKPQHPGHCEPSPGTDEFNVGVTGLSLLAFLGAGYTHLAKEQYDGISFGDVVKQGAGYLMTAQCDDGGIGTGDTKGMYNHAIATLALCEAYRMMGSDLYKNPAQKAVDYLVAAQNPGKGWRYRPRSGDNDSSVTGWALMALKSAELSGLVFPRRAYSGAHAWFEEVTEPAYSRTGYTFSNSGKVFVPGENENFDHHETLFAISLFSRALTYAESSDHLREDGTSWILKDLPALNWTKEKYDVDYYYWFFGTQALYRLDGPQGNNWLVWKGSVRNALTTNQNTQETGCKWGSWETDERWSCEGGRVYATAINALTLEVCGEYGNVLFGAKKVQDSRSQTPTPQPPVEDSLAATKAQAEALLSRLLTVDPELEKAWPEFTRESKDQGISKLVNQGVINIDTDTIRGGGAYFSFITRSNSNDDTPQLELSNFRFSSRLNGVRGGCDVLAPILNQDVRRVTLEDCPEAMRREYAPSTSTEELRKFRSSLGDGPWCPADVGRVYAVRWACVGEADTLATFQVVARDEQTITIAWRILKHFEVPKR